MENSDRDEQLRIMEGILQAKETIIKKLEVEVMSKTQQLEHIRQLLADVRADQDLIKKECQKEIDQIKNMNRDKVYIETQWGNNLIYKPKGKEFSVQTDTQWGSNITISVLSLFPVSEDVIVKKLMKKIKKTFNKSDASGRYANKYDWGAISE